MLEDFETNLLKVRLLKQFDLVFYLVGRRRRGRFGGE
jgi:hypothetical protein